MILHSKSTFQRGCSLLLFIKEKKCHSRSSLVHIQKVLCIYIKKSKRISTYTHLLLPLVKYKKYWFIQIIPVWVLLPKFAKAHTAAWVVDYNTCKKVIQKSTLPRELNYVAIFSDFLTPTPLIGSDNSYHFNPNYRTFLFHLCIVYLEEYLESFLLRFS